MFGDCICGHDTDDHEYPGGACRGCSCEFVEVDSPEPTQRELEQMDPRLAHLIAEDEPSGRFMFWPNWGGDNDGGWW